LISMLIQQLNIIVEADAVTPINEYIYKLAKLVRKEMTDMGPHPLCQCRKRKGILQGNASIFPLDIANLKNECV
jgi:hypothetical protein